MTPLSIRLFGPFDVRVRGHPLSHLRSRKGQWLLALLALRHGRDVERVWLAGTLWPDSPAPQAALSLRISLKDLRRALGPEANRLRSPTPRALCLDLTGAEADVVAFDEAITRDDEPSLGRAVALYRGPFLEGCDEEWAFQEREAREEAYLTARERLAAQTTARGDLAAAVQHLRLVVAAAPSRETAQRALMQALAASGNYSAASEVYRELRLYLHHELSAEPDPATKALFERIRAQVRQRAAGEQRPRTTDDRPPAVPSSVVGGPSSLVAASPSSTQSPGTARSEALDPHAAGTPIVLLYERGAHPDEHVLTLLETQLGAHGYDVFVDRHLAPGLEWAREIEQQVRGAGVVIPLLSAASGQSEMLAYQVQTAHEAAHRQLGTPRLLPVRVNDPGPLSPGPLTALLAPLTCALWQSPADDHRLVAQLLDALRHPPAASLTGTRARLEPVGGAVPLDSRFYVVRPTDQEFRDAIEQRDSIVLVKGARQMGKTSLLGRGLQQARQAGARVVLTDFQMLNPAHLASAEAFFLAVGAAIAEQLELDVFPDQVWDARFGPGMNFHRYMRREVLGQTPAPIVWGLDEVDQLATCAFGSEVFGLLRSWHNQRVIDPAGPWTRLTLAIAYATEAHLFIADANQSPFNVGTQVRLEDFTVEQVAELNRRYGSPLRDGEELARFYHLVGGHPHLVRRGLHEMAARGVGITAIEAEADHDESIFSDHLRRLLVMLAANPELTEAVRGVLQGRPCPTTESFYRLRSAGVISGDSARDARPRCRLYARYLERCLPP